MAILINGMEMPTNCFECPCVNKESGYCQLDKEHRYVYDSRPWWCPLVELPPHGRLIDADALIADVRKHSESYFADDFAHEWVDIQPTIIEAEEVSE